MSIDRPAGDFGRTLREARERLGLSLRQIADSTRISVRVLEALERNDISHLPGGIFGRGFVRAYAKEVGLDAEAAIQLFMAQFPHESVTAGHPASTPLDEDEEIESARRAGTTFVRLVVLSLPVAAVALYFSTTGRRTQPVQPPPPGRTAQAPVGDSSPQASPPPFAATSGDAGAAEASTLTIVLSASRASSVSLIVDGEELQERVIQVGERRTIDVHRELVVTTPDAGALRLTLNGAAARPLGRSGETVTARLSLANFRDYLAPQ